MMKFGAAVAAVRARPRWRAFALHLCASLVGIAVPFCVVCLWLYPAPYFAIMGMAKITAVILAVDVCIGPVLTAIVFNPRKRWLKAELALIVLLQLVAFAYGARTVYAGRPVYLVFNGGAFSLVSAYQIPPVELARLGHPLPRGRPVLAGARLPPTRAQRRLYVAEVLGQGADLARLLQYYVPYAAMLTDVQSNLRPLASLAAAGGGRPDAELGRRLAALARQWQMRVDDMAFVPMTGANGTFPVIVRQRDGYVLAILAMRLGHQ